MYKNILLILGFLVFSACSQNKPEPKVEVVVKTPIQTAERIPESSNNTEVVMAEPTTEFIPEHIKRSRIEVVKHY
jgi:PBP1b-binding outer membrane lipoprotein LpoB